MRALLATFQPLGANTTANAVSADGSVVVGDLNQASGGPFYWSQKSDGPVLLHNSSGNTLGISSEATGVSGDGSVIVGGSTSAGGQAFRWANNVAAPIPQLASSQSSIANSVSEDGSIIAGDIHTGSTVSGFTLAGTNLEIIPPPSLSLTTRGTIMSANGAVVAGNIWSAFGTPTAYQWKNGGLIQWPGNTSLISSATAVSPDGSVVVGSTGVSGGDTDPFEWTNVGPTYPNGVVTNLPLPAPYTTGSAMGVSNAPTTIVGWMSKTGLQNTAFIWTQANGVQDLQQVLTADGLGSELDEWTLTEATAITPDGNTIVGDGIDPQGQTEGWIVNLKPTPLKSITVTPASPSIPIEGSQQFTATGHFSDNSTENLTSQVTWVSATPSVATISATGLASALARGTSSITASLDGITGSTTLTVTPPLRSITVTPANPHIAVGATEQFTATGTFSDNSTENLTSEVIWTSATQSVATISSTGLAQAVAMGSSSITATLGDVTGEAKLTVTPPLILLSITVMPANPHITVGAKEQFIATGRFSDNSTENLTSEVIWKSATPSVATISTTGLASALVTGTSSITATRGDVAGSTVLTATPPTPPPLLTQTKTRLTATPRSLTVGRFITVSVSVSGARGSIATGTVTVTEGNTILGPFRLQRGKYFFRTKAISAGTEVFRAAYNGNTALLPSSSNKVGVLVRSPKPTRKRG